jgi:hypothetical protein
MSIQAYPIPEPRSSMCQRCGTAIAVYYQYNDDVSPPTNLLLCADCNDAELGRHFVANVGNEFSPPLPMPRTDQEARDLIRGLRDGMASPGDGEDTPPKSK